MGDNGDISKLSEGVRKPDGVDGGEAMAAVSLSSLRSWRNLHLLPFLQNPLASTINHDGKKFVPTDEEREPKEPTVIIG
ncbi:uncharacterized protein A4U43_C08F32110 [Asparagus officinalis]|nr:uncharacterized protein A4U43_C08F32110 [Asparagus officinalis]